MCGRGRDVVHSGCIRVPNLLHGHRGHVSQVPGQAVGHGHHTQDVSLQQALLHEHVADLGVGLHTGQGSRGLCLPTRCLGQGSQGCQGRPLLSLNLVPAEGSPTKEPTFHTTKKSNHMGTPARSQSPGARISN